MGAGWLAVEWEEAQNSKCLLAHGVEHGFHSERNKKPRRVSRQDRDRIYLLLRGYEANGWKVKWLAARRGPETKHRERPGKFGAAGRAGSPEPTSHPLLTQRYPAAATVIEGKNPMHHNY